MAIIVKAQIRIAILVLGHESILDHVPSFILCCRKGLFKMPYRFDMNVISIHHAACGSWNAIRQTGRWTCLVVAAAYLAGGARLQHDKDDRQQRAGEGVVFHGYTL